MSWLVDRPSTQIPHKNRDDPWKKKKNLGFCVSWPLWSVAAAGRHHSGKRLHRLNSFYVRTPHASRTHFSGRILPCIRAKVVIFHTWPNRGCYFASRRARLSCDLTWLSWTREIHRAWNMAAINWAPYIHCWTWIACHTKKKKRRKKREGIL
jgi:hypothetical protein